jgi:zinc transporter 1/2/3
MMQRPPASHEFFYCPWLRAADCPDCLPPGLALGGTFVKAQYTTIKSVLLAFAFVIITPLGVAIGAGIGASYQTESKVALACEGAFDSLSAGMLIYNAIADLMLPTFSEAEMPRRGWVQALGLAGLCVGAGIMALIGYWA